MDSTKRFSDRVENYVKYRPHYPKDVISFFSRELGLKPTQTVADIGSGTGILTKIFLEKGNTVYGIEPNEAMRKAGEEYLAEFPQFKSVIGTAEVTTLGNASVDFIVAAQAFHWFEPKKTRLEFARILKPGGTTTLIWNDRSEENALGWEYEQMLHRFGTDYKEVSAKYSNDGEAIRRFFTPGWVKLEKFNNGQFLDYESLKGRLLSSSYIPKSDSPQFQPMLDALKELFDKHQKEGKVRMEYDTKVFYGQFA